MDALSEIPTGAERVRQLTDNFDSPNSNDSFRSLAEQVLEDIIVGGFGAIEMQLTGDPGRPIALWPVDGATIMMRTDWDGQSASPRYAQSTGKFGTKSTIPLNDDELIYIRLNGRSQRRGGA